MRQELAWALAATIALSCLVWWTDERVPDTAAAATHDAHQFGPSNVDTIPRGGAEPAALPAALPPFSLSPATRDIFEERASLQAAPTTIAKPATPAPVLVEQPTPQAPPLQVRYAGSVQAPDGQRIVYLTRGDSSFEIHRGDRLDEGFVVEAIGEASLSLVYPPLGTKMTVALPPASAQ